VATPTRPAFARLGAAIAGVIVLSASAAAGAGINVVLNGQTMQFDQPPVERQGRVFVPLRGVFEKLGASVVYSDGIINATGDGRTIRLQIGSTNALVNGSAQQLDVAPFVIGARTYVPLRFVSQALGANVDYDASSQTVNISSAGAAPATTVQLVNVRPAPEAVVAARSPAVSGAFSASVDPNSVRISLDGRDVSSTTDISGNDFLFTPPYALTPERHVVRVTGKSSDGTSFDRSWEFTTGTSSASNYLTNLRPVNGSTVSTSFSVSGTTMPNASVHIVAVPTAVIGGVLAVSPGTYVADVTADSNGTFSQTVNVTAVSGGSLALRITSVAPTSNASATASLNLRT
jgi:hypothetical protein